MTGLGLGRRVALVTGGCANLSHRQIAECLAVLLRYGLMP